MKIKLRIIKVLSLTLLLSFSSCNDDNGSGTPGPGSTSAIGITAYVSSGESFPTYIGAFSEMPTGELPFSEMIEFSGFVETDVFSGFFYVYNWGAATFSRYTVEEDLTLTQDGSFSFVNRGLASFIPVAIYSNERAFIFDVVNGKLLEWSPETMTITSEKELAQFPKPSTQVWYNYHGIFGDKIILPGHNPPLSNDGVVDSERTVGIFDVNTGTMEYFTDTRVHSAYQFFLNDDGMAYFSSTRDDYFQRYFGPSVNKEIDNWGTLIRFDMNTGQWDPNFELDLEEIIGGEVSHTYPLNNNEILVGVTQLPFDSNINAANFFFLQETKLVKLNLNTLEVSEYNEIGVTVADYSNANYTRLDGDLIYQASKFSELDFNGLTTNIWRVNGSGATKLLDISIGGLTNVERIR